MERKFDSPQTARDYLGYVGAQTDEDIQVFEVALALAATHRPSIVVDKYRMHLDKMMRRLGTEFDNLCAANNSDDVNVQHQSLVHIFTNKNGYIGDETDYHNLQNVDVMRVVDRRMGMPITLCIIAIALCRAMGWVVSGINFPGHFLMQMDKNGQRLIIDPFQQCRIMAAPDLRLLVKRYMGENAELSNDYYVPCSNRDMLLRLQNNIKYRLIESEHYSEALEIVDLMMVFAPNDNRLRLDLAVLLSRLESPSAAIEHLQIYIDNLVDGSDKDEAILFMSELTAHLN